MRCSRPLAGPRDRAAPRPQRAVRSASAEGHDVQINPFLPSIGPCDSLALYELQAYARQPIRISLRKGRAPSSSREDQGRMHGLWSAADEAGVIRRRLREAWPKWAASRPRAARERPCWRTSGEEDDWWRVAQGGVRDQSASPATKQGKGTADWCCSWHCGRRRARGGRRADDARGSDLCQSAASPASPCQLRKRLRSLSGRPGLHS